MYLMHLKKKKKKIPTNHWDSGPAKTVGKMIKRWSHNTEVTYLELSFNLKAEEPFKYLYFYF